MDTSQRITTLCDGDLRSIFPEMADYINPTIGEIQAEYIQWLLTETGKEFVIAFKEIFTQAIEQLKQLWEDFKKALEIVHNLNKSPKNHLSKSLTKDWKRVGHNLNNNFRNIHHKPLMIRMRCRWRPRESHRILSELSHGIVILDEYACANERVEGSDLI